MFDKKEKTENKSEYTLTRLKNKMGKFVLDEKNEVVLREQIITETYSKITHEWEKNKPTTKDIPISELGWVKKLEDFIVLKKIVPSRTIHKGFDLLLFLKKIKYEVRDDKPWCYIQRGEGNKQSKKILLRNFNTGVTGFTPTNSNDVVKVSEHGEKPVTKEQVLRMYKENLITEVYDSEETVNGEKIFKKRVFA